MAGKHRYRPIAGLRAILGRGPRARPPIATTPGCTIGFADGPTGIAHRVTTDALAAPARYHCLACERGT
ncbi:MAG: hypothetical protein ACRDRW_17235 [Pseudonocardiaceae bacterium]